ncbi:MAG: serine aminopeptidase domain-containing protein [Bacteriovoracaceae bacterium]
MILSKPSNAKAMVFVIHGSGGLDADGTVGPYKTYKNLADQLYEKGIAVARFSKRSSIKACGMKMNHPRFNHSVFIQDAKNVLNEIVTKNLILASTPIFILGHSQGVNFASLISNEFLRVKGQILMAGLGKYAIDETLLRQLKLKMNDPQFPSEVRDKLKKMFEEGKEFFNKLKSGQYNQNDFFMGAFAPFWVSYIEMTKNAAVDATKVKVPSLVVQGDKDINVTEKDFEALVLATKEKSGSESRVFQELDHFFVKKGETVVHQDVTSVIAVWIEKVLSL